MTKLNGLTHLITTQKLMAQAKPIDGIKSANINQG